MGLDDFIEDDNQSSSSSSSSSSSTSKSSTETDDVGGTGTDKDMSFYGTTNSMPDDLPLERDGAMSDYSMSDLLSMVEDTIEIDTDNTKFYAPIFFTITQDVQYNGGELYQLSYQDEEPSPSWDGRVISCIGSYGTRLGSMRQETAMFAVGEHQKSDAMKEIKSSLGEDIDPETQVYINFFGDAFFMRDLAQANDEYKEGDLVNRDDVISNILRSKALRSRMSNNGQESE